MVNKCVNTYRERFTSPMKKVFWLSVFVYFVSSAVVVYHDYFVIEPQGLFVPVFYLSIELRKISYFMFALFVAYMCKPDVSSKMPSTQ